MMCSIFFELGVAKQLAFCTLAESNETGIAGGIQQANGIGNPLFRLGRAILPRMISRVASIMLKIDPRFDRHWRHIAYLRSLGLPPDLPPPTL